MPPVDPAAIYAANLLDPAGAVPHPADWIRDRLGEHLWSKQDDICDSVFRNRRTAVRACFDVGKSFTASRLAAWWIECHPPGSAFVVSTAPTFPQVRAILWREIGKAHRKGKLAGRVNQTEWWMAPDGAHRRSPRWDDAMVGFGRKPGNLDATAFQGIHERFVLVIIDEAAGVPASLWDAAEGLIANEDCRILAIGNPESMDSRFAEVCAPGSNWNELHISAMDSPNLTGEWVPPEVAAELVSETWVEERRQEWGEASPEWFAKVLGEFPPAGEFQLYPADQVRAAMNRTLPKVGRYAALAVDVARFGKDRTVLCAAWGPRVEFVGDPLGYAKTATTATTGLVVRAIEKGREDGEVEIAVVKVDADGVGGGVHDELFEQGYPVGEMHAGGAPDNPDRFVMARDEWHWRLHMMLERGEVDLPESAPLFRQLTSMRWKPDSRGRIRVESKEDMRKRGLPSPDHADAVVMALAEDGGWKPSATAPGGDTKTSGLDSP